MHYIPHSKLFQLFDSPPIPLEIRLILKDLYTNTKCSYDSFSVMPLAGLSKEIAYIQSYLI